MTYVSYAGCSIAVVIRDTSNACCDCLCLTLQLPHTDQPSHRTTELSEESCHICALWEGGEGSL